MQHLVEGIPSAMLEKPDWLVAPDGPLSGPIPIGALPIISDTSHGPSFLKISHTLRIVPSELLLTHIDHRRYSPGTVVALGDPVYSNSDPRAQHHQHAPATATVGLARLVSTGEEIKLATKTARSGILLAGRDATWSSLQSAIATNRPEIIHVAVHVVAPEQKGRNDEAALALSVNDRGIPELVTPEMVASLTIPGSLVILNGCASEQGEILPSAGLMGLARTWLIAGASGVVVTTWAIQDDASVMGVFYRNLQAKPTGTLGQRAAAALAETQRYLSRQRGSSDWAAYSVISRD